ncbi:MAG: hypothetical protein O2955_13075 [Planctomycetota bacterium]|nr:hypothetical protein [Planctomycetota bacterium]
MNDLSPVPQLSSCPPQTFQTSGGREERWLILFVMLLVFVDAAWRWPVPSANEPHYLTMARHQWDPEWCDRDLFLQSTPAHSVFYRTIGLITVWLTFDQAAWVGRLFAFALVAWGWVRLSRILLPDGVGVFWATIVYLILASQGSFSGEWIVRGCEAKVFSYGLLLWALSAALSRRWISAALCWGLSISFHPLVGLWSLLCYTAAELSFVVEKFIRWEPDRRTSSEVKNESDQRLGISWKPLLVLVMAALPGLLTSLALFFGMDPKQQYQATYIQVFYRLAHHLDPMTFPVAAYFFAGILIVVWLCGRRWTPPTRDRDVFSRFIGVSIAIAALGLLIGWGPRPGGEMPGFAWRMSLLKFYPFRLFDGMMPIATAFAVVHIWHAAGRRWMAIRASADFRLSGTTESRSTARRRSTFVTAVTTVCLALWCASLFPSPADRMSAEQYTAWREACDWIERETPADALFITPNQSWGFKWYAQRAEYVNMKDCPQDPPHLVEWNRRLKLLANWGKRNFSGGYTRKELQSLQNQTSADYLLAQHLGPMTIEPVFQNKWYRLYSLTDDKIR